MTLTQKDRIAKHLITKGKITTIQAFTQYRITRLSAHIHSLRREGATINGKWAKNKKTRWMVYKLESLI